MNDPSQSRSSGGLRAWTVLFGALTLAAGHGAFLLAALYSTGNLGNLPEIGRGRTGAAALSWLLLSPLLALLSLALRKPLSRSRALPLLAGGALLLTLAAFAYYLPNVVRVD